MAGPTKKQIASSILSMLAQETQRVEHTALLATTAVTTAAAASTGQISQALSSSSLFNAASHTFIPGAVICDGAARLAFGLSMLVYTLSDLKGVEKDLAKTNTSLPVKRFEEFQHTPLSMAVRALFEMLKGAPELYYGLQALATHNPLTAFYGLAITSGLEFCDRILIKQDWLSLDTWTKGIEMTGWILLATGNPLGAIFLGLALASKLYPWPIPSTWLINRAEDLRVAIKGEIQQDQPRHSVFFSSLSKPASAEGDSDNNNTQPRYDGGGRNEEDSPKKAAAETSAQLELRSMR
ncbi:MAG: hypothetical protein K0S27_313 [Gammaproteobacteria bacterium]|jgi:hypothetical protein|nr:hypothetical protein [Gammaproteobacteria bacterium]